MKHVFAVIACAGVTTAAGAQQLDDAALQQAIRTGEERRAILSVCTADSGFGEDLAANMAGGIQKNGSFSIITSTNAGRVAILAYEGKRIYKPLTVAQVPGELREPALWVAVEPNPPTSNRQAISVAARSNTWCSSRKHEPMWSCSQVT
jgi:hypothetical protein